MGCGVSKESGKGVVENTATKNGKPNSNKITSSSRPNGNSETNGGLSLNDPELEEAATKIQATYRGYNTRKQIQNKMSNQPEEEVDIDLNDPEVAKSAAKIQASFRGHQARREKEKAQAEAELVDKMEKMNTKEEDEELPDLSDPELNKAATKIQAQFKGHMVRKTKTKDETTSK